MIGCDIGCFICSSWSEQNTSGQFGIFLSCLEKSKEKVPKVQLNKNEDIRMKVA